ncbi:MAG: hypothetical protein NTW14_00175 [bacterium]|nr:hypothetical protein [bacterium]
MKQPPNRSASDLKFSLAVLVFAGACITASTTIAVSGKALFIAIFFALLAGVAFYTGIKKFGGPLCKDRVGSENGVCPRCAGIYSGLALSIIGLLGYLLFGAPIASKFAGYFAVGFGFILILPSAIQGYLRRKQRAAINAPRWSVFIFGVLSGVSPFAVFLGFQWLLKS